MKEPVVTETNGGGQWLSRKDRPETPLSLAPSAGGIGRRAECTELDDVRALGGAARRGLRDRQLVASVGVANDREMPAGTLDCRGMDERLGCCSIAGLNRRRDRLGSRRGNRRRR